MLQEGALVASDWLASLPGELGDRPIDLEEVLRRIVDEATHRLDADRGTLYLLDHASRELVSRVAHLPEIAEIRLRVGEGVAGGVAERGLPARVSGDEAEARRAIRVDQLTGYATRSLLAVPLTRGDVVLGVLQLLNKRGGRFTADDEIALSRIASQVVGVLDDTSLRSQLQPDNPHPLAFRFNHIVGGSRGMQQVYARLLRAAPTQATVLVRGETGTGKELVARAVHHNSDRRGGPLVKVDCAALPEGLIENELFGHERGAFTGADRRAEGKVAAADGGTLFLDEIGELSLPVQGRLLRLMQDRAYLRVGGATPERADVRFVCATHVDLEAKVAAGQFRQDLYYRLRVVEIHMPPLRERGHADLERLIDHFLFELTRRHGRGPMALSADARAALHAWSWPGNVRELQHCLESAVILSPTPQIERDSLPSLTGPAPAASGGGFQHGLTTLAELEQAYVRWALDAHDGNKRATARTLGIGRNTLQRKLD